MRIIPFWIVFKVTDLFSTYLCLTKYTKTMDAEANPVMKSVLENGSWLSAFLFLALISAVLWTIERRYGTNKYVRFILWLGVFLNVFISIWNTSIYIFI